MTGSIAINEIEARKDSLIELAQKMWDNPELAFHEVKASEWTAEFLRNEGFEVEVGHAGLPTAIKATWGSGKPVIGYLGEFDALPVLSQKVSTVQDPIVPSGDGHGCGHCLMTPACIGAALGAKKEMIEKNLSGTLVVYACPAEEVLTGKGFMARGGAFRELDIAFSWHSSPNYNLSMGNMAALNNAKFHFRGKTAHAGFEPFNGRSALDAAELMNVGANFLREHVPDITRIHYAFQNSEGAPNVVPDKATMWYFIRAGSRESVEETYKRLIKVAEGAAMMTETEVEVEFLGGCYEALQNETLLTLIRDSMIEITPPKWTDEEMEFAAELNRQSPNYDKLVKSGAIEEGRHLDTVIPEEFSRADNFGSTDVSDVQHIVPTVLFFTANANIGAAFHTWQITSCVGHSIGRKGALYGAKAMAMSTIKAIENPEIIEQAKEEFKKAMNGKEYICPVTDEIPVPQPN